jgi:hypothetical protein
MRAEQVGFTWTAGSYLSIPVSDILTLVPGIGRALRILLSALPGQRVSFGLGQVEVNIPVHRRGGTGPARGGRGPAMVAMTVKSRPGAT